MRSQKQVRRIAKVRSMKNAAAGKWKTYRKRREARKAWQNNTILTRCQHFRNILAPPPSKHRRIKEQKQRSLEQLAERQRLREQRRLEKQLTKQRASTSTLQENKKEKKLGKLSTNGPKKAPNEQKVAPKATNTKYSTAQETAKSKLLVNEQVQCAVNLGKEEAPKKVNALKEIKVSKLQSESKSKQEQIKAAKSTLIEEQKISHSSLPIEPEQEELMLSAEPTIAANRTNKKSLEKEELIEQVVKNEKDGKVQLLDSTHITESQEPVAPTVLHSVAKNTKKEHSVDSDILSNAKSGNAYNTSKEKALIKEEETGQLKQATNKKDQNDVHKSIEKVEEISEEQKKRNRGSDLDSLSSQHDFVKADAHEMDHEEAKADFKGIADEKRKGHGKQQSKSVKIIGKDRNANDMITEEEATFAVTSMDKNKHDHSVESDVLSNAKGDTAHDSSKKDALVIEKETVQLKQTAKQKNQIGILGSTEQVEEISEERRNKRNQRSDVVSSAKGGTAHDSSKEKTQAGENETAQLKQVTNKEDQIDVHGGIEEIEEISELKNKRNQRSDPGSLSLSQHDFAKGDTRERDEEAKADFMEMADEKRKGDKKQQSKSVKIIGKDRNANDMVTEEAAFVVTSTNQGITSCAKETKNKANLEKKNPFSLPHIPVLNHVPPPVRERVYKLLPRDVDYCVRMIERHGEDYEAMAKDQGNVFGDSAKGIARKIRVFRESPQYEVYLRQKAERNG